MIKRARKVISMVLIATLLINSNVPSFAQLVLPADIDNSQVKNLPAYNYYKNIISSKVNQEAEGNLKNPYIEAIISEKYLEILNDLRSDIYDIGSRISSLERREEGKEMHVNSTIVEPASVRANATVLQIRLGEEAGEKKELLKKLEREQNGYGRIYTIERLLLGEGEEAEEGMSEDDKAYYEANKEEIEAFEDEYVHYLVSELMGSTKKEFLYHVYELIPYINTRTGERWDKIKRNIKSDAIQYVRGLEGINDTGKWVKSSDLLIKMLPFIKGEIGENNYITLLRVAHNNLTIAMEGCKYDNKCENYLNLLAKEVFLYIPGEEERYAAEIEEGYHHGVRAAMSDFGKREKNYEYYNSIMLTVLSNYLALKRYNIIEDIISTQEWAEEKLKISPISGLDALFVSTYIKAGLSLDLCRDVMTYYPDIPSLPSRKGEYKLEDGRVGNIWWDLGEMLREDGSKGADAVLEKEINKIGKKFDITRGRRGEEVIDLGHLGILKVSALANVKKNVAGAEEKAKQIMNTNYGDLSFDEEKAIDIALAERYSRLKTETSLGAVLTPAGEKYKKETEQKIKKWNNLGTGIDIAIIVISMVELAIGAVKLLYNGYKLGVGFYKTIKVARMTQQSAKQIAYIRKNIEAIQYFKAWKASGKAWATGLGAGSKSIVPAPAVKAVAPKGTPKAIRGQKVSNSVRYTKPSINNRSASGVYPKKSNNSGNAKTALGKMRSKRPNNTQTIMWEPVEPQPGVIQPEKPTTLTATIGEGGGGAAANEGKVGTALADVPANPDDVLIGRGSNGYYITAERDAIYQAEIDAMNKASAQSIANYKPNNLFKKSYNKMNKFERFITNTQANGSYLWRNVREAFTATVKNPGRTVASASIFGVGEAPAVEARALTKAPVEIVSPIKSSPKVWEVPVNLYNPKEIAPSISLRSNLSPSTKAPKFKMPKVAVPELRDILNAFAIAAFNVNKSQKQDTDYINPAILAYYHELSKNPWQSDRVTVNEPKAETGHETEAESYPVPPSYLVKQAEAWGMSPEMAIQLAYGDNELEGRRELQKFIYSAMLMTNGSVGNAAKEEIQSEETNDDSEIKYDETKFIKGQYKGTFNNNTRPLHILVISDGFYEESDFEEFTQNKKVQIDFAKDYWDAVTAIQVNNGKYDMVFVDSILVNKDGTAPVKFSKDVLNYLRNKNLTMPVILFSEVYKPDAKMLEGFDGFLSAEQNDFEDITNYASNFFTNNTGIGLSLKEIFYSSLAVGAVAVLSTVLGGVETAGLAVAAAPMFLGGFQRPSYGEIDLSSLSPKAQSYVNLRKNFEGAIFEGPALTAEDAENLERILGKDFFNLWQRYYNQKLPNYAIQNPRDIEVLATYSKRYETTLRSQINDIFPGTNPLYVYFMKDITEKFEEDISSGKSFKDAVVDMGFAMYNYHKRINQIKSFLHEYKN